MYKNIIIGLPCLLILLTGCNKYLDKKSSNRLSVPETISHLQALLDSPEWMNQATPALPEVSSDDYFVTAERYNGFPQGERDQRLYTWRKVEYRYPNDWSASASAIYTANFCLDMAGKVAIKESEEVVRNNVYGSALFYRAYYFLHLAWAYAPAYDKATADQDLGIVMRLTSNPDVPSVRSRVSDVYRQVTADLKSAISLLPDLPEHVNRPSKAAAHALLARCYLSMRDYGNALLHAQECLKLKSDLMDYNKPEDGVDKSGNAPFVKYNKETIFYSSISTFFNLHIPRNDTFTDTSIVASYHTNDLRRQAFFRPVGSYMRFKGSYSGTTNWPFSGIATDELYLIQAECKARLQDREGALTDLNHLLIHRWDAGSTFTPLTAATDSEALELVLQERRKELLMRGLRWIDIKRLNREGTNITLERSTPEQRYVLEPNAAYYAIPLPADILNITGIPDNN